MTAILFVVIVWGQDVPTFHTGVFLVHVDTEVLGENGRPQTGLTKEDFRVFDGGKEQSIVAFSEGEQPLDLILLFDISGSMRVQVKKVAAVARQGLQQLRPGDYVSVMVFNTDAWIIAQFSKDLSEIERAIYRVLSLHFGGGTHIIDLVGDATNLFLQSAERNDQRRHAMLVTTDNMGWPSRRTKLIVENLWEADLLVNGLIVNNRAPRTLVAGVFHAKLPGGMEDLAEKTGGDIIHSGDLEKAFPEMMHRIRSRYTLYYRLPEGEVGSLRTIDVRLSDRARDRFPGARILARRGYRLQERDSFGFASRQ